MKIVSAGEVLWDVFEDSERLGGAPFNFAFHAARLGHDVTFISAVGGDERGRAVLTRIRDCGLRPDFIQTIHGIATGAVTVRVDAAGQPDFTIHRPAAYDSLHLRPFELDRLAAIAPDWFYFGTLYPAEAAGRAEIHRMAAALPAARRFYDINLRRDSFTRELVEELMAIAHVVKLNDGEAAAIDDMFGRPHLSLEEFTAHWSQKLNWTAVAVTRGAQGCAVRIGSDYAGAPGYRVKVADTVGAGDAFSAAFLHGLSEGWTAAHTGDFSNRVGAIVASRPGGVPMWLVEECCRLR